MKQFLIAQNKLLSFNQNSIKLLVYIYKLYKLMLGGLYGLNLTQHSFLLLAQFLPSLIVGLGLFHFDEALTTLIFI